MKIEEGKDLPAPYVTPELKLLSVETKERTWHPSERASSLSSQREVTLHGMRRVRSKGGFSNAMED